jgi:hypothetical protein
MAAGVETGVFVRISDICIPVFGPDVTVLQGAMIFSTLWVFDVEMRKLIC